MASFNNWQGGGYDAYTPDIDKLFAEAVQGESMTLAQDAAATVDVKRGHLLVLNPTTGKVMPLAAAETTVSLGATTEVIKNNLAVTDLVIPFVTAKPPIPGTVSLATTVDGNATPVQVLGTDNGRGVGSGADGWFTIDYITGRGVAYLAAAPTATHDLKAGYKHRNPGSGYNGLPHAILAEDVAKASTVAGDVVVPVYRVGIVSPDGLIGYSAGYREYMKDRGLYVRVASVE